MKFVWALFVSMMLSIGAKCLAADLPDPSPGPVVEFFAFGACVGFTFDHKCTVNQPIRRLNAEGKEDVRRLSDSHCMYHRIHVGI